MDKIEKIRQEIERRSYGEQGFNSEDAEYGYRSCARDLLSLLDTLQEPSLPSDAEKAAEKYTSENYYELLAPGDLANAFLAGAEWQKEQDNYDVIFHKGMMYYRKQMLEDAVGGTVHHALNCHYIMTDQKALNDRLRGIPEGTVVNIFICKAEEE